MLARPELVGRLARWRGAVAAAAIAVAVFAGAVAGASGSTAAPVSQSQLLARSRALWSAQHLDSYRFRLRISCDCAAARHPQEIVVRRGRPHGARFFAGQLQTFPQMFHLIDSVLVDPRAEGAVVRYDPRRGFPRTARIDSIDWVVDHFQAL
jgi:hypothetical protein